MPMSDFHRFLSFRCFLRCLTAGLLFLSAQMVPCAFAQTELATILGRVTDPSGAVVAGAQVEIRNVDTNLAVMSGTNGDGLYTIPSLHPGHYVISVRKAGFKTVSVTQLDLNVQDNVVRNFVLEVGSSSESITVTAEGERINTTDASVSTVVDRNFAENLPMNGRSFQTLIQLTPGVVLTANNGFDQGQFSVNGQRASSNYWMVDGVSANIGMPATSTPSNGLSGSLGSFGAFGGTNSLVSVDALQEFRIQTSTFAPEFGRTPGGQISIATRSGTDQFHGSLFDYFRNDVLDANDWFANNKGLPKPEERQNDFGGTVGGPILKGRTFFFFSYEGLRLRLPQTALTTVPDVNARQTALPALRPYLNAFPLPNGRNVGDGEAEFNASYSNKSGLDAYSLRLDHKLNAKLSLFARYDYSPSDFIQRGLGSVPLSNLTPATVITQTATGGAIWIMSPKIVNDLRLNYSSTNADSHFVQDNFGGAVPVASFDIPSPFRIQDSGVIFIVGSLVQGFLAAGTQLNNKQRQWNIVDGITIQRGSHSLKFGADYRRLAPRFLGYGYFQESFFDDVPSVKAGTFDFAGIGSSVPVTFLFRNLGLFAQDTWRVSSRLSITYGLRWDTDFAPSALSGPSLAAVTGYDLNDLSKLALAPAGTPPFQTTYRNVAPRFGLAYHLDNNPDWGTVVRGGFGVFYDLATSEVGNAVSSFFYPFGSTTFLFGGNFPFTPQQLEPPPITPSGGIKAFDPHLMLPYTLQWNMALEHGLGRQQTLSASYVGSAGRRLLQTSFVSIPVFSSAQLTGNTATSDYDALQVQFERRITHGLQALASYSWSHSLDTASAGSFANRSNRVASLDPNENRGPSDFDVRHALSAAVTYQIPAPKTNRMSTAVLGGWSLQSVVQTRTAQPVDVTDQNFSQFNNKFSAAVRPDLIPGQPVYLTGFQYPGGRAFNPAAFTDPPVDPNTGNPLRQGNLPRNLLRGFGAAQWDFAVHREFPVLESVKPQFRAELFNVINHPNFGPPSGQFGLGGFGLSTQMLGQSLSGGNAGAGAFSPLYQIGGPRSIQLALKLMF
jgi:hypothetical protein